MYNFKGSLDLNYQEELWKLAKELDTARWALYEIKSNSEAGRIIKVLIHLISSEAQSLNRTKCMNSGCVDTQWLTDQLAKAGFNKKQVDRTIIKLFGDEPLH